MAPPRFIRPPGILILPALRPAVRGFGSPSCFRSRFVSVRSSSDGGGGVASGDEIDERELIDDGDPGTDIVRGGVSMEPSSRSMLRGDRDSAIDVS